jgi:hypothetical protein
MRDNTPHVAVICLGGNIINVISSVPVEVLVVDYDDENYDNYSLSQIPQADGTTEQGMLWTIESELNPQEVDKLFAILDADA